MTQKKREKNKRKMEEEEEEGEQEENEIAALIHYFHGVSCTCIILRLR